MVVNVIQLHCYSERPKDCRIANCLKHAMWWEGYTEGMEVGRVAARFEAEMEKPYVPCWECHGQTMLPTGEIVDTSTLVQQRDCKGCEGTGHRPCHNDGDTDCINNTCPINKAHQAGYEVCAWEVSESEGLG